MLMQFISMAFGFIVGLFVLYQIMASILCGLRLIYKLDDYKVLLRDTAFYTKSYVFAIVINLLVFLLVIILMYSLCSDQIFNAFLIGLGVSVLITFFRWGMTSKNISEFAEKYFNYIDWDVVNYESVPYRDVLITYAQAYYSIRAEEYKKSKLGEDEQNITSDPNKQIKHCTKCGKRVYVHRLNKITRIICNECRSKLD